MRTHELARALNSLARALRNLPDMEIDQIGTLHTTGSEMGNESIALGLTTLNALSEVDKQQWRDFIDEHNFPIDIRPRDASRDIIGKLLTFLQANPTARNRLEKSAKNTRSSTSPELQRALQALLKT